MYQRRTLVAAVVLAAVVVGSGACASKPIDERGEPAPSTTTVKRTTTTTTSTTLLPETTTTLPPETTTTTAAPPVTEPPPSSDEPPVLAAGAKGPRTQLLQQRLVELKYDPGPIDGEFGAKTKMAIWAYQKLNGLEATGEVSPELWAAMSTTSTPPAAIRPDGGPNRVEIDIPKQVLVVYRDNTVALITHISSGSGKRYCEGGSCGRAVTPRGDYSVLRRIGGWRRSALGLLYNPLYFKGGYAIHGAPSVPNYPASHGCVRIPMHIAEYFPTLVNNDEPVYLV